MSEDNAAEEFEAASQLLRDTVLLALRQLASMYGETPLEAAEHLQAILRDAVESRSERRSLYDLALGCPPLMKDLLSENSHLAIARRWGAGESTVRRARAKLLPGVRKLAAVTRLRAQYATSRAPCAARHPARTAPGEHERRTWPR